MNILWQASPLTASQIVSKLQSSTDWAPTTIRTLLDRLVRKKAVKSIKSQHQTIFLPLLTQEQCINHESENFLKRIFDGATQPLLLHFAQKAELTSEEIRELQRILKEKVK
jgi:BlaI family penicillinase repressor